MVLFFKPLQAATCSWLAYKLVPAILVEASCCFVPQHEYLFKCCGNEAFFGTNLWHTGVYETSRNSIPRPFSRTSTAVFSPRVLLSSMSLPWVAKLLAIIESDAPINQKAAQALELLKTSGLAYEAKLKAKDLLIHTSNRGGAMVNAFDVVSKGEQICQVGWDLKKITQSVCVELPYEPTKRKAAIDANARLAEQSGGLLAKPFGQERFQSLSLSHTTSFLRSLKAGCKLGNDTLSVEQMVAQGDDFGKILQEGWNWTVVAAKVEEEVPALPGLLQQALNSNSPETHFKHQRYVMALLFQCKFGL